MKHPILIALRGALALLLSSILFTGCTSMKTVQVPTSLQNASEIRVGDQLEVQLKQGPTLLFKVQTITATELVGTDGTRVAIADIDRIKAKRLDALRTTGALGGTAIVVLSLIAIASLGSLMAP
jgi:hypothetical protein